MCTLGSLKIGVIEGALLGGINRTINERLGDAALIEISLQNIERRGLASRFRLAFEAYSRRNVTLGSSKLARRPGMATAAIAEVANKKRAATSTGAEAAPAW